MSARGGFAITDYRSVAGQKLKCIELPAAGSGSGQWQEYLTKRNEAQHEASAVSISTGQGGGGFINVRNTFGTPVVEIQANKMNEGTVYVNDANGKTGDALGLRMPH